MTDEPMEKQILNVAHRQDLMESDVKQKLEAISSSLHSVQADQRETVRELKSITALASKVERQGEALSELKTGQLEQMNRMETWFSDFEGRQNATFLRYETEQRTWRTEHETQNRLTAQTLESEVRALREEAKYAKGWIKGIGMLGALLIGSVTFIFNDRFTNVANGFVDVRRTGQANRALIDAHQEKIHEIELYLARGGERRNGPYAPPPENRNAK